MKRTDSFIHDFKIVKIEITTNVDDSIMKSLTPPNQSFLLDYFFTPLNISNGAPNGVTPEIQGPH
jgi:hypothetical protein